MKQITNFLFLLISISTFSQSPWTQEKKKFYTQLSFSTISNYNRLFGNPDYNTNGEITDNTIQFYGEYGLLNKTTLIVNLPLKLLSVNNSNSTNFSKTALGNLEIGLKHNFYKKEILLSGQFSVEANTSSFYENSGIRTGYDAFTFTPLFLAGKSFKKTYLQTFIGAKIRTNNYSTTLKIGGEFGDSIHKNISIIGFLDIEKSFEDGNVVLPPSNKGTGLYVNNQEYGVIGIKAIGEFSKNFGIIASVPSAFFGNNVAKQVALTLGIYKKF